MIQGPRPAYRRTTWLSALLVAAALLLAAALARGAAAQGSAGDEAADPLRWLQGQPLTLFDLGVMRLERDLAGAVPWLAESDTPGDAAVSGVQYDFRRRRLVVYLSLRKPRGERTEAGGVALFRRLVERLLARAPEGPDRVSWYLAKTFSALGRERAVSTDLGKRLEAAVHVEITLRGRRDDARPEEAGRMTCWGRLDAPEAEIERRYVH